MNDKVMLKVKEYMNSLPEAVAVFGYGSSFYKELDPTAQIDLIIVVENVRSWKAQKQINQGKTMAALATLTTPTIFYERTSRYDPAINIETLEQFNGAYFKTLVIEKENYLDDLKHGRHNYLAGRFQKSVINFKTNKEIEKAKKDNYHTALIQGIALTNKLTFSEKEVFERIISLSYMGDVRSVLKAEDPNKKSKILNEYYLDFKNMYDLSTVCEFDSNTQLYTISKDKLKDELRKLKFVYDNNISVHNLEVTRSELLKTIFKINSNATLIQGVRACFSNSPDKTFKYVLRKIKKGMNK